jgi:flagellar biosynthesis protein FlhG
MRRDPSARNAGPSPLRLVPKRGKRAPAPATDHPARWSRPAVRTLAITSGKGGVGKSNLAANLAVALGARGARVLLLDADVSQASLDLLLGVHPRYDLSHFFAGRKTLEEILVPGPRNVTLVPAASGAPELAELDDWRRETLLRAIGQLEREIDLVLVDTASGVSAQVTSFCRAVDDVIVLTTPEMPAFSDAYGLIKLLHAGGMPRAPHLLVTQSSGPEEAEETAHRIRVVARRFLQIDLDVWGSIPLDSAVPRAVRLQEPVVSVFPQAPAAIAYRALAARLWTEPDPELHEQPQTERLKA